MWRPTGARGAQFRHGLAGAVATAPAFFVRSKVGEVAGRGHPPVIWTARLRGQVKAMTSEDLREFFQQFQDFLSPKLDTYEQAIYLYIFRHTRFLGNDEAVIGFKSARTRIACGIGEAGKPMSENSAYEKLRSLQEKKLIALVRTEHKGTRIHLYLPKEVDGVIPINKDIDEINIEEIDFFNDAKNRAMILQREHSKCFYTLKTIDEKSFVIDHVVSRPNGDNGYRNVVAASREANNRKGAMPADDFLRQLFREGLLSEKEFSERIKALDDLKQGLLRPANRTL